MVDISKLTDGMKEALENNGYQKSGDCYKKQRQDGKNVKAVENGSSVILHLADEKWNILTQTKQPAIHPSIQIDDPNDLLSAENELCAY